MNNKNTYPPHNSFKIGKKYPYGQRHNMKGLTTQNVANQFVTSPKLCPALTASASTNSEMIKKGIGPNPTENPATNPKLEMTEMSRQE